MLQTGCGSPPPPTLDEVMGTYRLASPAGPATLRLNADETWEYDLAKEGGFQRSGKWERHARPELPSMLVLVLHPFEFGFPTYSDAPNKPSYFFLNLEHYRWGKTIRACLGDSSDMCFIRQK